MLLISNDCMKVRKVFEKMGYIEIKELKIFLYLIQVGII